MPIQIKRYANRKLYNTRDKHYVTLAEIGDLVRSGEDIQVIENTTGKDLTSVILSQIVVDQEKKKGRVFNPRSLTELIQRGSETMAGYARRIAEVWKGAPLLDGQSADALVAELVRAGHLGKTQARKVRDALVARAEGGWKRIEELIEKRLQEAFSRLQLPSRNDFVRLDQALANLEKHLARIVPETRRLRQ